MKKYLIGILVGILLGASGVVLAAAAKNFPDVSKNAYYYNDLQEMVGRGVVHGYQNGNFGPDDAVTRGQLMTILEQYDQSLTTYKKEEYNDVGDMIDVMCAKIQVTVDDKDIFKKFATLCSKRNLAGQNVQATQ